MRLSSQNRDEDNTPLYVSPDFVNDLPESYRLFIILRSPFIISFVRYTQTTLKKIEDLFGELDYTIRYEKGNFQSGYCLVENRRMAVVNRFFDTEARINCLMEILNNIEFQPDVLSDKSRELIEKWKRES